MNEKVKQALENFKHIKEDLDYFQPKGLTCTNREEQYKSIENALNDFDRYYESQQDLIKGKDEYIAKLCNDRAELKEENKNLKTENDRYSKYQENLEIRMVNDGLVIDILKEFAKLICSGADIYENSIHFEYTQVDKEDKDFELVKKVVEKYGK